MEDQIHHAEVEAYRAVLRAFILRENAISWEKEILMTDLRKELSISNDEHREILDQTSVSNSRKRNHMTVTGMTTMNPSAINMSSTSHVSHKRFKPENSNPSFFDWNPSRFQPLTTHPLFIETTNEPAPSSQTLLPSCENAEQAILSDPQSGQPLIPREATGQKFIQISDGRGEPSEIRNFEVGDDTIKIYDTNMLLQEVEDLLICQNADPARLAMAKKLLQDQERALLDGINKLTALISGDAPDPQLHHS